MCNIQLRVCPIMKELRIFGYFSLKELRIFGYFP